MEYDSENTLPLPDDVKKMLLENYQNTIQGEGDISVMQAADLWGVTDRAARARLDKMVKNKVLKKFRGRLHTGFQGYFYRPIDS